MPKQTRIIAIVLFIGCMTIGLQISSRVEAAGVVGTGTPASCTQTALVTAITGGGLVTFNCGASPATITISTTLDITSIDVTIDGGNLITLQGNNVRIIRQRTWGSTASTLTLQNITLSNGKASGSNDNANGAAIQSINQSIGQSYVPTLNINNVTFNNNDSTLTSFSSGGAADYGGGAIYSGAGIVNVQNSTFINNDANNAGGGAIHILRADLTISNSTFTTNSAIGSSAANSQGGAIYVDGYRNASHNLSITDSVFTGNTTYNSGGAIYINMYDNTNKFSVDGSSFVNNAVVGGNGALGGAISGGSTNIGGATGNASITITDSTFSGNSVHKSGSPQDGSGGAVAFAQRAVITIANSTFSGNSALGTSYNANGGAIYIINNTTQFEIINSTIASNFAGWVGGGISSSASGRLRNTIIAYNTADNGPNTWDILQQCGGELVDGGNNLQYPPRNSNPNYYNEVTCFAGKSAIAQMTLPDFQDPLLGALLDYGGLTETRALLTGSPAIDKGNGTVCAAAPVSNLDQRGFTRPIDGDGTGGAQCDIGAFEFVMNQAPFAAKVVSPADNAILTTNAVSFDWNPEGFATQYRFQIDDAPGFSSPLVDVSNITATDYSMPYLEVGTYYWRVESINGNGTAWSAARTFNIVSVTGAAPPRNYFTSSPVTLTWDRVLWATGYQIELADNPSFTGSSVVFYSTNADTLSKDVPVTPGVYYWRVQARREDGLTWGAWSAVDSFVVTN